MADREISLRLLVALAGVPLLLGATWLGGLPFFLLVCLIALRGQWELIRLLSPPEAGSVVRLLGMLVGIALLVDAWLSGGGRWGLVLVAGTLALLTVLVVYADLPLPGSAAGAVVLSWVYVTLPLAHLFWLREGPGPAGDAGGSAWLALGFWLMIWGADTAAYLVGSAWGRHPLIPKVSRGKSVEGTIGGIASAALIGAALGAAVPSLRWGPFIGGGIGVLMGTGAVIGDLMESRLKRGAGTKDSGHLLPGHGGVLDRFDSSILCAPLLYYVMTLLAAAGVV